MHKSLWIGFWIFDGSINTVGCIYVDGIEIVQPDVGEFVYSWWFSFLWFCEDLLALFLSMLVFLILYIFFLLFWLYSFSILQILSHKFSVLSLVGGVSTFIFSFWIYCKTSFCLFWRCFSSVELICHFVSSDSLLFQLNFLFQRFFQWW